MRTFAAAAVAASIATSVAVTLACSKKSDLPEEHYTFKPQGTSCYKGLLLVHFAQATFYELDREGKPIPCSLPEK